MPTELARVGAPFVGSGQQPGPTALVRNGVQRRAARWGVTGLLLLSVGLSGCTGSGGTPSGATGTATGTSATAPPGGASGSETAPTSSVEPSTDPGSPSGTLAPPLPNPAPSSIPKVTRPGSTATPTATAPSGPFAAPATYPDGVVVTVVKAAKAVETGQGPGVFNGRELVVFDLEITNGSTAPITVNQVVITTYYGLGKQLAPAVYPGNVEVKDFAGTAEAGAKLTARYAFAVPAAELGALTMVVDFDDAHASAIFTGSVSG